MSVERQERTLLPHQKNKEHLLDLYRKMFLIRRFEERAGQEYMRGKIAGFLHLAIGEEAANVGMMVPLRPDDDVISHYRSHGQALARGLEPGPVMAELFGRATGVSKGQGGSMHLASKEHHFWGGHAIVGGHIPVAVGMALAHQYTGSDRVVVCIFGDGSVNTGAFHEAMNLAGVWRLPVLFIASNNLYGMGTAIDRSSAVTEIYKRAAAYNMPGKRINGNDVLEVEAEVRDAVERIRAGEGPRLIEAMTYRFRGHSLADPELYRSQGSGRVAGAGSGLFVPRLGGGPRLRHGGRSQRHRRRGGANRRRRRAVRGGKPRAGPVHAVRLRLLESVRQGG